MAETNNKKKVEDYGSFNYSDYTESDSVKQAKDNLASLQKPGAYQSQWQQSLNDAINKIQNREKFSYDLNGDALYQQYKDQAVLGGQMAMQDTIGQAAAMTGGYGNSYAQGVGQQAYQGYLQKLNDKVPELYQLALDQYNREGEDLYNQYALFADRENADYGRYRDTVSDYNTDRSYYTDQYNAERDYDYSKYRDAVADSQWQQTYDEGVRQFDESMALENDKFAFTQDSWEKDYQQKEKQINQDYELRVRQIEEDERNGIISREVAQREIKLAEDKFEADKDQAAAELEYKYAALEASKGGNADSYEMSASEYATWADRMSGLTSEKEALALRNNMISAGVPEDIAFELYSAYWDKDEKKPFDFKTVVSNLFGNSIFYSPN